MSPHRLVTRRITSSSDRSRRSVRSCKKIVGKRDISAQKIAYSYNKTSWLSSNELLLIQNMRKHVVLHHITPGNGEKPEEKRSTRSMEIVKMNLNYDKTGWGLIILPYARFKYIWKRKQRRARVSNFIKIGPCAPCLPCVHLLDYFREKWLLRGGWFVVHSWSVKRCTHGSWKCKSQVTTKSSINIDISLKNI